MRSLAIWTCLLGLALASPAAADEQMQALAGRPGNMPDDIREAWGTRLYGCQSCQDVCPHNQGLTVEAETELGLLGPSLSLRTVLGRTVEEVSALPKIKELFRGSQMGLSWVSGAAILRNAIVAAGNHGDPSLVPELEAFEDNPDPVLQDSARWALKRLRT